MVPSVPWARMPSRFCPTPAPVRTYVARAVLSPEAAMIRFKDMDALARLIFIDIVSVVFLCLSVKRRVVKQHNITIAFCKVRLEGGNSENHQPDK
jgi:hypothetical protein